MVFGAQRFEITFASLNQTVMNKDKYVFSQLVTFLDEFKFLRIVKKYEGNKYIKSYTCWNQLLTMMFGQLSNRGEFKRPHRVTGGSHRKTLSSGESASP